MAKRFQLSRKSGWRMPPNSVKVDRSTKWGNPFRGPEAAYLFKMMLRGYLAIGKGPSIEVQQAYRAMAKRDAHELRGKDLGCWCKLVVECHADSLLLLRQRKK